MKTVVNDMISKTIFKIISITLSDAHLRAIKKVGPLFVKNKKILILLFFISILVFLFDLFTAFVFSILISGNTDIKMNLLFFKVNYNDDEFYSQNLFLIAITTIIILQVSREFLIFLNSYLPGKFKLDIERITKRNALINYVNMKTFFLDKLNKNDLVHKVEQQTVSLSVFLSEIVKICTNIFICILYVLVIILMQPLFFVLFFLSIFLILKISDKLVIIQEKIGLKIRNQAMKFHDKLTDTFHGINIIKVTNSEKIFLKKNNDIIQKILNLRKLSLRYSSILSPIQRSMLLISVGGILISLNKIGTLFSFEEGLLLFFFLFRLYAPISEINSLRSSSILRIPIVEAIADQSIENKFSVSFGKKIVVSPNTQKNSLIIKNISFCYKNGVEVLKNISFQIKFGQTVGIVGRSGCGKTTLIKLLMNLYSPSKGNIYYGDENLKNLDFSYWVKEIGYVPQKGFIFNGSIYENVTMFDNSYLKKDILRILYSLGLKNHIKGLAKGIDSLIGDTNINLSGGQRQKLMVARALVKKPEFLFLDEATNEQDSISQNEIIKLLQKEYHGTIIIVSHNFSTLKSTDIIFVLKNGRIIGKGGLEELNKSNKDFKDLLRNQIIQVAK